MFVHGWLNYIAVGVYTFGRYGKLYVCTYPYRHVSILIDVRHKYPYIRIAICCRLLRRSFEKQGANSNVSMRQIWEFETKSRSNYFGLAFREFMSYLIIINIIIIIL